MSTSAGQRLAGLVDSPSESDVWRELSTRYSGESNRDGGSLERHDHVRERRHHRQAPNVGQGSSWHKRRFSRPASRLAERWTTIDDVEVFYRESPNPPDAPVMVHLHGFGLSGRYLMPTAEALADEFHTLVPDLPGFGRSGNAIEPLTMPSLRTRLLPSWIPKALRRPRWWETPWVVR